MQIAKIESNNISIADYRAIFPQTSFPPSGPSDEFLAENDCMKVSVFKAHDSATEKLVQCDPYIDGNFVYTCRVEPLTNEEMVAVAEAAKVKNNAAIWRQIDCIERDTMLPRHVRDLIGETHPGYVKVSAISAQIAELKNKLS